MRINEERGCDKVSKKKRKQEVIDNLHMVRNSKFSCNLYITVNTNPGTLHSFDSLAVSLHDLQFQLRNTCMGKSLINVLTLYFRTVTSITK